MRNLHERARPARWDDVVGQERAVARLRGVAERTGLTGRAYWLTGQSGTGKTTIAKLIAAEVADDYCTVELDASELTPARLRELEADACYIGLGKGGRAFIVNEAHGLRRDAVRQLLVMLERIAPHVVWVFTTTVEGQLALFDGTDDAGPLLSRCVALPLAQRGLAEAFADRLRIIARTEGLGDATPQRALRLVNDLKANMRAAIQAVEAGAFAD